MNTPTCRGKVSKTANAHSLKAAAGQPIRFLFGRVWATGEQVYQEAVVGGSCRNMGFMKLAKLGSSVCKRQADTGLTLRLHCRAHSEPVI